ncbi:MAG: phosphoglycerate kinase [Actinomycetota bacterium]|nr:phosphoglycerate kinase [Actinomycetota bacterium]
MAVRSVRDLEVAGKRVLVRVDFNVPLDESGGVKDDTRIRAALPTLELLRERGAALVVMSHLGRPKGKVVEELRLDGVAARLGELLGVAVRKIDLVVGEEAERAAAALSPGEVLMLENLRFEEGEEKNDPAFAAALARLGDLYVDDAFGAAHRAHASVVGVAELLPSAAGLLMEKEVSVLQGLLRDPARPFVAVLGGSKVSDKLKLLGNFQRLVDTMLIGGGMCFTMLKAQGVEIGASLCEDELLEEVKGVLDPVEEGSAAVVLPADLVVAERFEADAPSRVVSAGEIPAGWMGLDIGPDTVKDFKRHLEGAATIFWNGPMGVFEWERFQEGTRAVAEAIASSSAVKVAGGGDTIAAIEKYGLREAFTHISTGGGASMEMLEGRVLPGVAVLEKEQG